jgi:pyruvate formate lyase activating enzyme
VEKDRLFYDESGGGVTFSGGEPLQQPEFLLAALRACGERELHRVVDTCGLARRETLLEIAAETDLFLYDLKVMDPARHRETTGARIDTILANLRALAEAGHAVRVRVPVVPGISDDDENIDATAAFVRSLPGVRDVSVLPFHTPARAKHEKFGVPWRLPDTDEVPAARLEAIAARLARHDLRVDIGG